MTDFSVSLTLAEAEVLVNKVSDLVGPGLITIQTHVTISTDVEKAARMLAILFEQAPENPEKKMKAKKKMPTTNKPTMPKAEAAILATPALPAAVEAEPMAQVTSPEPVVKKERAPHSIISLANGAPKADLAWELLNDERKVKENFTNDQKTAMLANGLFTPGELLRYKKNGTIRQVAGAIGQPQKLEPLGKGA